MPPLRLLEPTHDLLDRYAAALRHGFEPRPAPGSGLAELRALERAPKAFVAARLDAAAPREGRTGGTPIRARHRWLFDVVACDFAGAVVVRPAGGSPGEAPPGRIRVVVCPWWRRRGYGRSALALALATFEAELRPYVLMTCDAAQPAAVRLIEGVPRIRRVGVRRAADDSSRLELRYGLLLAPAARVDAAA